MQEAKNYVRKLMVCGQQGLLGQLLVLLFFSMEPLETFAFIVSAVHCYEVVINRCVEKKKKEGKKTVFFGNYCSVAEGKKCF